MFKKKFFISVVALCAVIVLTLLSAVVAEIKSYTGVGVCAMGDLGTPEQAKNLAREKALQNAREQAGVYIQSYTRASNTRLATNELSAITNSIIGLEGEAQYQQTPGEVHGQPVIVYTATVVAKVDTDGIKQWLARDENNKNAIVQQNTVVQKELNDSIERLDKITEQYNQTTSASDKEKLRQEYVEAEKKLTAAQLNHEGLVRYRRGDYDGAIKFYSEALRQLEKEHDNANAAISYTNRAIAYHSKRELGQAISDCNQALAVKPDHAEAFYQRGAVYSDKGQFDQAIADFDKAIALNPNDPNYYNDRALVYGKQNQLDRAIFELTTAVTVDPNYVNGYYNRGYAYELKNDKQRAIAEYTKAVEINPECSEAYNNRARMYEALGNRDLAFADFDRSIRANPKKYEAYVGRGTQYFFRNDYDRAIADWKKALSLNPPSNYAEQIQNNIRIAEQKKRGNTSELDKNLSDLDKALAELKDALAELGNL